MAKTYRQGAIGALLDEYQRAISDLELMIDDVSGDELLKIVDSDTLDDNCKSIQTILCHVVSAGYGYAVSVRRFKGAYVERPRNITHLAINGYKKDLNDMFVFTQDALGYINENELEEHDNSKKIMTLWGQVYDVEQIMEHAIVHVLRHRRQIERFKIILRGQV